MAETVIDEVDEEVDSSPSLDSHKKMNILSMKKVFHSVVWQVRTSDWESSYDDDSPTRNYEHHVPCIFFLLALSQKCLIVASS